MSNNKTKTVSQVPSTKEDNVAQEPVDVPEPATQTITLQEAVVQLEKLYIEKEEEVKDAQIEATKAQQKLSQKEKEALTVLRRLTPLQNRFLLNTIEVQKKQIDELSGPPVKLTPVLE